jgi:ATPase subunit of ABC transporter with duplicated ATPase domains
VGAIHLDHVSFSYSSAIEVFRDVSVHLGSGWTGVVGPNGAGKSTLFSLIVGELQPSSGTILLDPRGGRMARCRQEVDRATAEIRSLTAATDGLSRKWVGRLGIDPAALDRWDSLSPGERKRFQLAAALASQPSFLLLDEPTNHLDANARPLVEGALARFDGVGLVISHDREFLDRLTVRTLRVRGGALRLWSASYSVAAEAWTEEEAARTEALAAAGKKEKALKRRLADERRTAEQRNARFHRDVKRADSRDHDARSMAAKGRAEAGRAAGQRRRTVLRAALEKAGDTRGELTPIKQLGRSIFFDFERSPKRRLLHFSGPLMAGSRELVRHVDVTVLRDDRIRLMGPNGVGKSTLLKALIEHARVPLDRVLYLPQELTREKGLELLLGLGDLPKDRRGRVLSVVAALGVDPDELLSSGRPSPGEARKLAIALGLGVGVWAMILDEPTNHLDLPAVGRVESALADYPGAVVLVTHDETFGARSTETVWALTEDGLSTSSSIL